MGVLKITDWSDLILVGASILLGSLGQISWLNGALWFLPSLWFTKMVFYGLKKYTSKEGLIFAIALLSIFGGIFYYIDNNWFFGIPFALRLLSFYGLGYLVGGHLAEVKLFLENSQTLHPILIFSKNYFYYSLGALFGITAIVSFSFILVRNRILQYVGRKSLTILVWHQIVFRLLHSFFLANIVNLSVIHYSL